MKGFIEFIRKQGVVGLAIGFIVGGAVSKLVTSLVSDIINPIISGLLGGAESLSTAAFYVGESPVKWGSFVNVFTDFIVISLVVYWGFKFLKLDRLDLSKE